MSDSDHPDAGPRELDDVADQLRDALRHVPAVPVSADPGLVDELGRRSAARRRGKIAALTAMLVCLVVASGVALAATRHGSDTTNLAAGDDTTSSTTGGTETTVVVSEVPSTSNSATSTSQPDSSSTSTSIVVGIPTTTVPTGSSLPSSTTTGTTGSGGDCGYYGPVGWPTTFVFSPIAAQCLLDAFASGTPDTFHLVIADTDYPAHQITEDFLVVGVRQVQVRVDRTKALDPPKTVVTQVCRQLSYAGMAGAVYAFSQCS